MNSPHGELTIFSGTAHPALAHDIAENLSKPLGPISLTRFPDGEIHVLIDESVRGKDVFVIQPTCPPVNENFVELLIILDALVRASAERITVVTPYYGYARQDKKTAGREPITARMVADVLTLGGADRLIAIDLHSPQIQGFFRIPVDHLSAVGTLAGHMRSWDLADSVIVAPDAGRVHTATEYASRLDLPVVILHKRRTGPEQTSIAYLVDDVRRKRPIIIDDMITTGGTVERAVTALLEAGCAPDIRVAATHPIIVGRATEVLSSPAITRILFSDTVPVPRIPKVEIASIAPLLAAAIRRIHTDSSVSDLFFS
ncbi:MAG: ribose-phosphate diphosphokinase [Armatimonadota bacterium]